MTTITVRVPDGIQTYMRALAGDSADGHGIDREDVTAFICGGVFEWLSRVDPSLAEAFRSANGIDA